MHTAVPAGWVDVVRMAKRRITLEEHLRESDMELQKIQRELKAASAAVLETQHFALIKSEEARSYRS